MILPDKLIIEVDQILDDNVSDRYKREPLAQDWARIAKVIEELGECISELIAYTGQNPRKTQDPSAYRRMVMELADVALTAVYAMQHFTKDEWETQNYLTDAITKHHQRLSALA